MSNAEFVQEPLHVKPAIADVPMTFGQIRVSITAPIRAGRVICSDWIDSGLGKGTAMLNVELLDEEGYDRGPIKAPRIIFGRTDLFEEGEYIPCVPNVRMGEVLDTETGWFKVAIRFRENYSGPGFTLIWNAYTMPSAEKKEEITVLTRQIDEPVAAAPVINTPETKPISQTEEPPIAFYIENPPKLLHPGWRYTLRTNLGAECERVSWSAPEGAGTINEYGEYTAPDKQGMYEISASYNQGEMTASVYVVVMN